MNGAHVNPLPPMRWPAAAALSVAALLAAPLAASAQAVPTGGRLTQDRLLILREERRLEVARLEHLVGRRQASDLTRSAADALDQEAARTRANVDALDQELRRAGGAAGQLSSKTRPPVIPRPAIPALTGTTAPVWWDIYRTNSPLHAPAAHADAANGVAAAAPIRQP